MPTVSTTSQLRSAVDAAGSGDEIVARGGTYDFEGEWNVTSEGESGNPLVIRVADGEHAHIRFAAGRDNPTEDSGIKVDGAYVTVRGFEISNSGYKGIYASQADGCVFEDLDVHHCNVWGIMNNGADQVTFRNCDSHDNFDPQNNGQHSDGINMTGPANNGLIEGCRAWNNGDDGFDMWVSTNHTIRNCWSWNNGSGGTGNGNGFKLGAGSDAGGGGHVVYNCVSYGNHVDNDSNSPGSGFWWNGEDQNSIEVYNCTAWDNGVNFAFADTDHVLKNNVSFEGPVDVSGPVVEEANSWNVGIDDPEFRSLDPSADGFLRPSESSPCIGAGVPVGLDFGTQPDLGAFPLSSGGTGDGGQDRSEDESTTDRVTVDGATTLVAAGAEVTESALQDNHSGFNGAGFINFTSEEGASARWPLEVATDGTYNYAIRYANGDTGEREADFVVGEERMAVTFPTTNGWASWSTVTGTLELPSGTTDLAVETTGEDAGNVDRIALEPADEGDAAPAPEPSGDTPNHGYATPEAGRTDWHSPLNENFAAIDRDVPVVDAEGAKGGYTPVDGALYVARDTGAIYVGDGSEWRQLGTLV